MIGLHNTSYAVCRNVNNFEILQRLGFQGRFRGLVTGQENALSSEDLSGCADFFRSEGEGR